MPRFGVVHIAILGREVLELERTERLLGQCELIWHGQDIHGLSVPAGMYLVRFTTNKGETKTKSLLKAE